MSLYPSLEDMKVHQMYEAEARPPAYSSEPAQAPTAPYPTASAPMPESRVKLLYPSLNDYLGMDLSSVPQEMQVAPRPQMPLVPTGMCNEMVAPLSGTSMGLYRAQVSHGVREVTLCKDVRGKIGLRVECVNKGVFVVLVEANSPAAMVGLRFGDQILTINDETVAGYSVDKVHNIFKKARPDRIVMAVRDRPFERTVTLHKDSVNTLGFGFRNGRINSLVKDSSAARNGLLIDHQLLEVNGRNVVGMKDKEVGDLISAGGNTVTITVMPSFVYDHLMKYTAGSLIKKMMDHSLPDL